MMQANLLKRFVWAGVKALVVLVLLFSIFPAAQASPEVDIYQESLAAGWQNWSWDSTLNFASTNPVRAGSHAVAVTYNGGWAGLYLRSQTAVSTTNLDTLTFWLHGGQAGGQQIAVKLIDSNDQWLEGGVITAVSGTWTAHELSLADFGNPTGVLGLVFQEATGSAQPTFYVDSILLRGSDDSQPPTSDGPALTVDANAAQRSISPYIYGMNFPDPDLAAELQLPLARWGGNATTRYNWQLDVSNRASDWFFENIANDVSSVAALPHGSASDRFVQANMDAGSESILTIPLIGWTPKSRNRDCGFSVAKYGNQTATDPWAADCGNGVAQNGSEIVGNDPRDTSVPIDEQFVQDWIEHLTSNFGTAANGGVRFYNLDNEPMLWPETHRDVHPQLTSYDEVRDLTYRYAAALKAADPAAQTLGPVVWGWPAYHYSAADGDWWLGAPDRAAHGGLAFVPWYLQEMAAYEAAHDVRILDYLDLHYYPQQENVALQGAGNAATQALRLRSTRLLWDESYVDESWINEQVELIPRMRRWVDSYYPGTKLALSEYNWGGLEHINGAVAQADVLGIFGREGLDLATLWSPPTSEQPGAFAFRMFLNYDGQNGRFGETSVLAQSADQEDVAIYASRRSADGALLILMLNKTADSVTSPLTLDNHVAVGTAQQYRYSAADLNAIVREADLAFANGQLSVSLPAMSMTLLVVESDQQRPPEQPQLTIKTDSAGVMLHWSGQDHAAVAPVLHYRIYRTSQMDGSLTTPYAIVAGDQVSWVDNEPSDNSGLHSVYVITAVNDAGQSPFSNRVASFKYQLNP